MVLCFSRAAAMASEIATRATTRVEAERRPQPRGNYCGDLRKPPRRRADAATGTTSRRWRGTSTLSSRRSYGDNVASTARAREISTHSLVKYFSPWRNSSAALIVAIIFWNSSRDSSPSPAISWEEIHF